MKVITVKTTNAPERVVGIHYFGPGGDEAISGYAVAMKLGLTKRDLDKALGVHPCVTEDLFMMEITKRSGEDHRKTSC